MGALAKNIYLKLAPNGLGLCVRFCLAESSILSTNVNGKTCTKPVLVAAVFSR